MHVWHLVLKRHFFIYNVLNSQFQKEDKKKCNKPTLICLQVNQLANVEIFSTSGHIGTCELKFSIFVGNQIYNK